MGYFDEDVAGSSSKAEFVYRTLRNNILNGIYAPGTALYIRELSIQLNVSRTPVKEAISRLAYEGYVELLPNRCAIVSRISSTEVIELLELRETLERSAAFYAAQRRTEEDVLEMQQISERHRSIPVDQIALVADWDKRFHMAVAKAAYNRQLYQAIEKVFVRLVRIALPISRDRLQDSIRQHEAVLTAIREQNAEAARRNMSEHNQDILNSVKLFQYQNIHLFK
ncbi:MAG: GntR family transcriptional regulator [Faecousia sp.]